MSETKELTKESIQFNKFLDAVAVGDYPEIRKKIINQCEITAQVFIHWKNSNSRIAKLAKPIINQIASEYLGTETDIFNTEENEPE